MDEGVKVVDALVGDVFVAVGIERVLVVFAEQQVVGSGVVVSTVTPGREDVVPVFFCGAVLSEDGAAWETVGTACSWRYGR